MGILYLNNIDLNGNQLLNAALQNLGSDPGSPATGQFWLNTSGTAVAKYYTGASTITLWDADTAATASKLVRRDASGNIAAAVATFTSVTISGTVTNGTDAATKAYVDALYNDRDWKDPVRVASTASVTISSAPSAIDGVTLTNGDRVLLKDQSTASQNGIYVFNGSGSAMTRSGDASASAMVTSGMTVPVTEGTANDNTIWFLTTNNPITLATTSLAFTQVNNGTSYTQGTGISISGNVISLASGVATPGTYSSVTVDTYGRVTAGADIVTSNGIVTRTASGTFVNRTVTGTSNRIALTNGNGVSGNPTIDIDAAYVGQSSITTLGTIGTGVWNGTSIAVANGGTGSGTASGARANLGATGKYSALVGDGSSTSIAVTQGTHGLASNGQMVGGLFDASSGDQVFAGFNVNNSNGTVTLTFAAAPASNAYRLVLVG